MGSSTLLSNYIASSTIISYVDKAHSNAYSIVECTKLLFSQRVFYAQRRLVVFLILFDNASVQMHSNNSSDEV